MNDNNIDTNNENNTTENTSTNDMNTTLEPPCASGEKEVISTIKPKKKTNFLPTLIIIIILLLGVSNIDKILNLFDKNDSPIVNNNDNKDEIENHNLVDGFIVLNDNNSYIKIEKIKFYNFVSLGNNITLNYISDITQKNISDYGIYIEFYNANKEFIYRQLFNINEALIDSITTYSINIKKELINDIKYAKVRKINKNELDKKHQLVCRYKQTGQGYNLIYKNTYNFIGELLSSYEVNKEINITMESTISNKYKNDLLNENNNIKLYNIETKYDEKSLSYNIELTNNLNGYTPLYEYNTSYSIIKNNEILKKWECE